MQQIQSVPIRARPASEDVFFEDIEQEIRSKTLLGDSDNDADSPKPDIEECEPDLPKARKVGPLSKQDSRQIMQEDASVELTLNLFKIRPEEELKLTPQSNSEFFAELSKSRELSAKKEMAKSKLRKESQESASKQDTFSYNQQMSTLESEQMQPNETVSFEQAMNTMAENSVQFSEVLLTGSQISLNATTHQPYVFTQTQHQSPIDHMKFSSCRQGTSPSQNMASPSYQRVATSQVVLPKSNSKQMTTEYKICDLVQQQPSFSDRQNQEFLQMSFGLISDKIGTQNEHVNHGRLDTYASGECDSMSLFDQSVFAAEPGQIGLCPPGTMIQNAMQPSYCHSDSNSMVTGPTQSDQTQLPGRMNFQPVQGQQSRFTSIAPTSKAQAQFPSPPTMAIRQFQQVFHGTGNQEMSQHQFMTPNYPCFAGSEGMNHAAGAYVNEQKTPQPSNKSGKLQQANNNNRFTVDLERILRGEDSRTTIMIRHIPNKYTQRMLLEKIDKMHAGRYDFFYLPIDLKNNCNVGYAFINFLDPVFIVPFYEDLNGKSWEKFNSDKICEITYGRIQGKQNLDENFSCSAETRRVKPLNIDVPELGPFEIQSIRNQILVSRTCPTAQQQPINRMLWNRTDRYF